MTESDFIASEQCVALGASSASLSPQDYCLFPLKLVSMCGAWYLLNLRCSCHQPAPDH